MEGYNPLLYRNQKCHTIILLSFLAPLLLFSIIQPQSSKAALVWSDDFNDGNMDGWTETQGNCTVINNVLRGTGIDPQWNFATHPSNVAYGTWEFDVHVTDTPDVHFYVYLISFYGINYRFSIFTDAFAGWTTGPEFVLLKTHGGSTSGIGRYDPGGAITGWYHFEVTRDETGHFEVSIDGVLRMELDDNDITQSNYFIFASQNGPGIDNIEVSDLDGGTTGTTDATPPPGIPGFPWLAILIAIPLALGVAISRKRS